MTTAILSPPKHYRKDDTTHSPIVELVLALIAHVAVPVVEFVTWFLAHKVEMTKVLVLVVVTLLVGTLLGLHLAGVR